MLLATGLRAYHLGWPPLWADEAESTINALAILETGLPRGHYLGLPSYENVFVQPWPESAEYAFRDISYSDRDLAVYHGWLPLYAIAGALRLAGVTPDAARHGPPVRDGTTVQLVHWTAVPRAPALVFSALLVLLAFALGRRTGGEGAGWAMAAACAAGGIFVWFGRQARYYSPALAVTALCGLAIWTACRRGLLRDHLLAGLSLALAFHTHVLTAIAAGALYLVAALLFSDNRRDALRGVAAGGATAALLVLPWAVWAGFFDLRQRIPAAHRLLDARSLLHSLPSANPAVLAALVVAPALAAVLLLRARRRGLPARWRGALAEQGRAIAFAGLWFAISWASFVLLAPAASYFVLRLKLQVAVPGLLFLTLVIASAIRVVRPSVPAWATPLVLVLLLVAARQVPPPLFPAEAPGGEHELVRLMRSWRLAPGARVYAMPANQFALTYYGALPVQSVSAVRRSWLDGFASDLVILDGRWYEPLDEREVRRLAALFGVQPTPAQVRTLAQGAVRRATEERLREDGYPVAGAVEGSDALSAALVEATRRHTAEFVANAVKGTPLGQAARFEHWGEFWRFFFFWFAEPAEHLGANLNFRRRALRGRVHVLPSGWTVYDCRPNPGEPPLVSDAP